MIRIAFIDDGINQSFLESECKITSYTVEEAPYENIENSIEQVSHGTLCAEMFIRSCKLFGVAGDYEITSIQFKSSKEEGDVTNLIAALELCKQLIEANA